MTLRVWFTRGVRILGFGDIGVVDDMMHIGDEAMFEEFLVQARARGVSDITAVSSNPAETSQRYSVPAVARDAVDVGGFDGVVITGAGNLASTWPVHIVERLALARAAEAQGIPLVITGQTLGPYLTDQHERMLATLLTSAQLVGVRESTSHALASRLGVDPARLRLGADDASFLGFEGDEHPATEPYALVSLSTHVGAADRSDFVREVAALLDHVARLTGLDVVFLAHFGALVAPWQRGDVVMHEAVVAAMREPSRTVPTGTPLEAARLARSASMVVSSRYHPAVFAAPAGVPVLGIAVDDYTTVKLTGALGNFGQSTVVQASELSAATERIERLWAERAAVRERTIELARERRQETNDWWNRVFVVLSNT